MKLEIITFDEYDKNGKPIPKTFDNVPNLKIRFQAGYLISAGGSIELSSQNAKSEKLTFTKSTVILIKDDKEK